MEKINIAEILRNCPQSMELYSPLCGKCVFDRITMGTIICKKQNTQEITFTSEGYYMIPVFNDCECMLFPSKDQRDWSKFQRPFKDGDVVVAENKANVSQQLFLLKHVKYHKNNGYDGYCYFGWNFCDNSLFGEGTWGFNRLATEEEKEKLFDTIKANGYKWDEETKTLAKLIKPKFKVGDKIKSIFNKNQYIITELTDTHYTLVEVENKFKYTEPIIEDKNWEPVPNKFDITTLIPFESKVLARDYDTDKWHPGIWGFYDKDAENYPYRLIGDIASYCIPYEGNEHLLGRTDDCDNFYKTWEK